MKNTVIIGMMFALILSTPSLGVALEERENMTLPANMITPENLSMVLNTTSPSDMTMQEMADLAKMLMTVDMEMPMNMPMPMNMLMPMNTTMPMSIPMKMADGITNNIVLQNVTLYIIMVQNVSVTQPSSAVNA